MTSKEFYTNYNNGHVIYECNKRIIGLINGMNPYSVLEYGCGTGKNLNLIRAERRVGIDLSRPAIVDGIKSYEGIDFIYSDEAILSSFRNKQFDVSFTVSVLDHIEDIDFILEQLKVVSGVIYALESKDKWQEYCYAHDYLDMGFKDMNYGWKSPATGADYRLYECTGI